jgi:outer membrane protein assembly factor BamD
MKQRYGIAFIVGCLLLSGCASTKDPADEFANQSAQQIYQSGELALAKGKYATAVRHYEGLDALYPFSSYSEQAMLDSIYAYYQSGDPASAAATAARFIHTYPGNSHVDYAYYMKGVAEMIEDRTWPQRYFPIDLSTRDPGSARKAYNDLGQLIQLYPNSSYAPDAKQRMVYLRNMFANGELHVAQYYFIRHAYVASANRASYVLAHFNGTPATEEALGIMVLSYQHLGETAESNKAQAVLQLNYPNSTVLHKLQNLS